MGNVLVKVVVDGDLFSDKRATLASLGVKFNRFGALYDENCRLLIISNAREFDCILCASPALVYFES
jgi:hypothetical protein